MCGLFGYSIIDEPTSVEGWTSLYDLIESVANAMDSRGGDSWGIVHKHNRKNIQVTRGLGDIARAGAAEEFAPLVMAHTRYATVGAVHIGNSHPFQYGRIVGSHNGGIWNSDSVAATRNTDYEVDSMALIDGISRGNTSGMTGYGAVQWLDMATGDAYLCRMNRGDLVAKMVRSDCGAKVVVWASTFTSVKMARSNLELKRMPQFSEGKVYRLFGDTFTKTQQRIEMESYQSSYGSSRNRTWEDIRNDSYGCSYSYSSTPAKETWTNPKVLTNTTSVEEEKPSVSLIEESAVVLHASETSLDCDWIVFPHEKEYGWAKAFRDALDNGEDPMEAALACIEEEDGDNLETSGISDETGAILLPNMDDFIGGIDV